MFKGPPTTQADLAIQYYANYKYNLIHRYDLGIGCTMLHIAYFQHIFDRALKRHIYDNYDSCHKFGHVQVLRFVVVILFLVIF